MANTVFYIIIGLTVFDYLFGLWTNYLNSKTRSSKIPPELEGVYDAEKYAKQQEYGKVNSRFSYLTSSFSFVLIMLMLLLFGFAWIDAYVRTITEHYILMPLLFFAILGVASDILNTPFDIYDTFVIEQRFGFNTTTVKTYIFDKLKGWFLGAVIGGGLLALIIWFYYQTGEYFWLWTWAAVTAFMIFMNMFYSSLIVPLFNKQTPLEEGELRNAIQEFSNKAGFKLDNVFVIDGSKRSTKANAYFSGLGKKKRIVLYDTLIKDLSAEEIVAVLAHEIGHYKKKHTQYGLVIGILQTGLTLFLLGLFIGNPALSQALGVEQTSFHIGLIAFGILYSPISMILGLGQTIFSRKNEYQADDFAAGFGLADQLISSLKKLSQNNLSNLTPHPIVVFLSYSHPTLLQRIRALKG
ncbi:MAG: M48 family metallopeptidase [Bacteroidales bacterium]|nr:M48 family metallopeptidase [Bacteroidales bacterium]MCF8457348.1 M48 family metallopeptidase [Bacteroidales bacterium]